MPIYEFRCPNGHVFEVFQRMDDPDPEGCETCGAGPVQRVFYPIAVHFKGSGFYSTDYGRKGQKKKKEAAADSGGTSSESGGGEKKEKKESAADA
jgi:putative FmdB family regulatory protein